MFDCSVKLERTPRGLIVFNGGPLETGLVAQLMRKSDLTVATDGAYQNMIQAGLNPNVVLGDMDSVQAPEGTHTPAGRIAVKTSNPAKTNGPIWEHRPNQNFTDSEKAIDYLWEKGYSAIDCVSVLGNRLDHSFFHFLLLEKARRRRIDLFLWSPEGVSFVVDGSFQIKGEVGEIISIFPFPTSPIFIRRTTGLKYPILNKNLSLFEQVSISNALSAPVATVELTMGLALVFIGQRFKKNS